MTLKQLLAVGLVGAIAHPALINAGNQPTDRYDSWRDRPIKHLVVIFDENISFDHYFGTYPNATNPAGEPAFHASADTPTVNGLEGALLTNNPNKSAANGAGAANPFRLDRTQAWTASQNHDYMPEQAAFDRGLMDLFPAKVGTPDKAAMMPSGLTATTGITMGYYDGNTVTAMWNYAQHYAMSDNSYDTGFGPSTVGALNLIAGQTNGVSHTENGTGEETSDGSGGLSVTGDPDPYMDKCSGSTTPQAEMKGQNIGNLLSAAGLSWGWFEGGFDLTKTNANGTTGCARSTASPVIAAISPTSATQVDYVPHHQPFQYYPSTRNPQHTRPSSVHSIGHDGDAGNHQYDIHDFYDGTDPAGLIALRSAIASHLAIARGIVAEPSRIVIVSGIQQGIAITAHLFLADGTAAVVENPGYQGAVFGFANAGAEIVGVRVDEGGLVDANLPARGAALAYVTPSHQYPSGGTLAAPRRERLIAWARRHGCYLVEDDYDSTSATRARRCRRSPRWRPTAPSIWHIFQVARRRPTARLHGGAAPDRRGHARREDTHRQRQSLAGAGCSRRNDTQWQLCGAPVAHKAAIPRAARLSAGGAAPLFRACRGERRTRRTALVLAAAAGIPRCDRRGNARPAGESWRLCSRKRRRLRGS